MSAHSGSQLSRRMANRSPINVRTKVLAADRLAGVARGTLDSWRFAGWEGSVGGEIGADISDVRPAAGSRKCLLSAEDFSGTPQGVFRGWGCHDASLTSLDMKVKPDLTSLSGRAYVADMTPDDEMKAEFGKRLKEARENAGLTQQHVADQFTINKGTVSAWETGRGDPPATRLHRIAVMYGVSADELLSGKKPSAGMVQMLAKFETLDEDQKLIALAQFRIFLAGLAVEGDTSSPGAAIPKLSAKKRA